VIHYREGSLNPNTHLHNGDPLVKQTTHVPKLRPPLPWPPVPWDTGKAWIQSALDALQLEKMVNIGNWPIERCLYEIEAFNGFGPHWKGKRSNYLWNWSNLQEPGGIPCDHCSYDPNYVSGQAGAATLLRILANEDIIPRS
jgi:lysozyme family protein